MSDKTFPIWRFLNGSQMSSLYYYNGNFFHPLFIVAYQNELRVRRLIRLFMSQHKALVRADRSHPDYLDKIQLAEAQGL